MEYAYFPGCALEGSAKEYDLSFRAMCERLGIGLREIEDWCCCGATAAHMTNDLLSVALPTENLLWAQECDLDVTTPCAACFGTMKTAFFRMEREPDVREKVEATLEAECTGTVEVRHSLDVVTNGYGLDAVKERVEVALEELKVAAYYGCLLLRPPDVKAFGDPENHQSLDELVLALGAEPVEWTHRTICCGASFSGTHPDIAEKLSFDILDQAKKAGAECLVVACPLCHANLDMNQEAVEVRYGVEFGMPVFYFSQLLGIALGLEPRVLGLDKNVVEPWKLLERYVSVDYKENVSPEDPGHRQKRGRPCEPVLRARGLARARADSIEYAGLAGQVC